MGFSQTAKDLREDVIHLQSKVAWAFSERQLKDPNIYEAVNKLNQVRAALERAWCEGK